MFERRYIFQTIIFGVYVSFLGCIFTFVYIYICLITYLYIILFRVIIYMWYSVPGLPPVQKEAALNQKRLCEVQIPTHIPTCWKQWVTVLSLNRACCFIQHVISASWAQHQGPWATLCPTEQNRAFAYNHVFQLPFQHLVQHGFYKNATVPDRWS